MESILTSIKKLLGVEEDYEQFDADIIIYINSVFMILNQLGVGPSEGFSICDKSSVWEDFTKDPKLLEAVKTYVYLKVRLLFDPPINSSVTESIKEQLKELQCRILIQVEYANKRGMNDE